MKHNIMKPLYILKIGGSVATYKNRPSAELRKALLGKIAQEIFKAREKKGFDLILIHGAGSVGHQMAHRFGLKNGSGDDPKKTSGALALKIENQKFDAALSEIFLKKGLWVSPVHTASVAMQKDGKLIACDTRIIKECLKRNIIPILYGEMVFDEKVGLSVCSGDAIAPCLAKKLGAEKIFFASDIDGIFTKDPYHHRDAELVKKMNLSNMEKSVRLSGSHNVDVTGGLGGKINNLKTLQKTSVKSVEIFNGLQADNYRKILLGEKFPHTEMLF